MISNACWGIMRNSLDIKLKACDRVTSPKNQKMSKFPITRVRTVLRYMAFRQSSRATTTNMCCVHLQHLPLQLFSKYCSLINPLCSPHSSHTLKREMLASHGLVKNPSSSCGWLLFLFPVCLVIAMELLWEGRTSTI